MEAKSVHPDIGYTDILESNDPGRMLHLPFLIPDLITSLPNAHLDSAQALANSIFSPTPLPVVPGGCTKSFSRFMKNDRTTASPPAAITMA